jgi:hypothetical protein
MVASYNNVIYFVAKRFRMNPKFQNTLAVIAGIVIGSSINMTIVLKGHLLIAMPEGADVTTEAGLKASLHLFQPKHFIMPFLAHALGTLGGSLVVAKMAATNPFRYAMAIGVVFMLGGIINAFTLPGPVCFDIVDILGAYLPMSYLALKLAK